MGTQQQTLGNPPSKCPEGYTVLFGPLCIEQTTLKKIEDIVPDIPDFNFTDPSCESALSALKGIADTVDKALKAPKQLMAMAKNLIERPFADAQRAVEAALGVIDGISDAIDNVLRGAMGPLSELKAALQKMLDCPFVADMPIAKTAAALLDAIENGLDYRSLLSQFKGELSNAAREQINAVKDQPLAAIDNLQKLYDDMLQRSNIAGLLQQMNNIMQCVEAACNMLQVAKRLPKTPGEILTSINGVIDQTTGKLSAAVVKAANSTQQAALKVAEDIAVIKMAGVP